MAMSTFDKVMWRWWHNAFAVKSNWLGVAMLVVPDILVNFSCLWLMLVLQIWIDFDYQHTEHPLSWWTLLLASIAFQAITHRYMNKSYQRYRAARAEVLATMRRERIRRLTGKDKQ